MGKVLMAGIVPKLTAPMLPLAVPSAASNMKVTGSELSATITWTNPAEFHQVIVTQKAGSAPTSPTDGTQIYVGTGAKATASNLALNTKYYWAVFVMNEDAAYSKDFPTGTYTTPESTFPNEPYSYSLINTYRSSQTLAAPEDGWFQIVLQGASGKGGNGYGQTTGSSNYHVQGGAGGGGGGASISRVKLNKGDTIKYTHASVGSTCSVVINSSLESYSQMQVTSGGNASSLYTAGSGGAGSGGNYGNYSGSAGSVNNGGDTDTKSCYSAGAAGGSPGYTGGNTGGQGQTRSAEWDNDAAEWVTSSVAAGSGSASFVQIYRGSTNLA